MTKSLKRYWSILRGGIFGAMVGVAINNRETIFGFLPKSIHAYIHTDHSLGDVFMGLVLGAVLMKGLSVFLYWLFTVSESTVHSSTEEPALNIAVISADEAKLPVIDAEVVNVVTNKVVVEETALVTKKGILTDKEFHDMPTESSHVH